MSIAIEQDFSRAFCLDLSLAWHDDRQQEERFQRLLKRFIAPLLIFFLALPWLPVFENEEVDSVDEVVKTQLILEPIEEVQPPPPPPPPKPKVRTKQSQGKQKAASQQSSTQSLAALSNQLNALRGGIDMKKMQNKNLAINTQGQAAYSERSSLGSDSAIQRSGGIVVDAAAMSDDGTGLAVYNPQAVEGLASAGNSTAQKRGHSSFQAGKRDMESIRRTFEHRKASVYALYTEALRRFPELNGKFTFKLVIEPDGSISRLKLVSSELGMAELEKKILAKIASIHFGAADVSATPVQYKFVFLPS
ncbi:hypothetical protein EDC56_1621 [Sinobacterium caligoides]|uniref:TonB family protein n=1 Tax=Sinobacterium caligoides TaxID=933926 RepID=A0A3N2DN07_9GAMM|nr:AgmX/PglI C-terminal domain-containing protein [Sinobacterium caligoides]ROS01193.1 hypothetical protein EDC56_1621 [Sinobacterium caligoides]